MSKLSLLVVANGILISRNNPIGHIHIFLLTLLFTTFGLVLTDDQQAKGTKLDYDLILSEGSFTPNSKFLLVMTSYSPYSMLSSSSDQTYTHSLADPGEVLPPIVETNYNGTEYNGKLIAYEFRRTDSFSQLSPLTKELSVRDAEDGEFKNLIISPDSIITTLNQSSIEIKVENGSKMKFVITNNPSQLPPASLSITAYSRSPFEAVKVLDVDEQDPTDTSFRIDLASHEKYLLIATATWSSAFTGSDQNNDISGYAIYAWPTDIV